MAASSTAGRHSLLDSYSEERQPVGRQLIDRVMKSHNEIEPWSQAAGLRPGMSKDDARANLDELFGDSDRGKQRRRALLAGLQLMDYQFNAHGVELGQRYRSSVIRSAVPFPKFQQDRELYFEPDTVPGSHLPHVWVQHDGQQVSTLDVADYAGFTLLTVVGGKAWIEAAKAVATELGVQIKAARVGLRQDFDDLQGEWTKIRGVSDRGCVLVRPDRFIAWRSQGLPDIDASVNEVAYSLDTLKVDGFIIFASYGGKYLGDEHFAPLLEELNLRKTVAFIHPNDPAYALPTVAPASVLEFPFETMRSATSLIISGALRRFADIRFILMHAGGALPYLVPRVSLSVSMMPGVAERVGVVNAAFSSFYYDTALSAGPSTISALMQVARPDHVLFGSDFPMAPVPAITNFGQELESFPSPGSRGRTPIDGMLHGCSVAPYEFRPRCRSTLARASGRGR